MKYPALVTLLLYALILLVFIGPFWLLAFVPRYGFGELYDVYFSKDGWSTWIWFSVMVLCEAGLLFVHVRKDQGRPITRRTLLAPIIASGLMAGILFIGVFFSVFGLFENTKLNNSYVGYAGLGAGGLLWIIWSYIFYRSGRTVEPAPLISSILKKLIKGSILELVIAVPTHIYVRSKDYCCAPILTFASLVAGISVMLFAFGPGIYFLFRDRIKRLRRQ